MLAASLLLAATGAVDDLRPLGPFAKLVPQVARGWRSSSSSRLPPRHGFFPCCRSPWSAALAVLAGVWFVNLVNFMDGIDWITVAGCGVPLAALAVFGRRAWRHKAWRPHCLAGALCGALIGFSPFNKPVARVFLGDVGSLPIGLILGYGLYRLALAGHLAAALILPLYYLWDSGATLVRRLSRGEPFWEAHRSHVYQRATDAGWSVAAVVGQIFVLDLVLGGLAFVSVWQDSVAVSAGTAGCGHGARGGERREAHLRAVCGARDIRLKRVLVTGALRLHRTRARLVSRRARLCGAGREPKAFAGRRGHRARSRLPILREGQIGLPFSKAST